MNNQTQSFEKAGKTAIIKFVILLALSLWLFWSQITSIVSASLNSSEQTHALAVPVAILALFYCRRKAFSQSRVNSSGWGILLLIAGIILYAAATWPFNYGYVRDLALLPVLAGIILIACGGQVLKLSVPMLLLVILAIPVGSRLYASLVIRPETITISATAKLLDLLPGVRAWVKGTDLYFSTADSSGIVALAETNRGSRLLLTFAVIGVFITFSRIRSLWRIIAVAIAASPIVFFGNFLRFLSWALIDIYAKVNTLSDLPRNLSAIFAILVVYGLFVLVCEFSFKFLVEDNKPLLVTKTAENIKTNVR